MSEEANAVCRTVTGSESMSGRRDEVTIATLKHFIPLDNALFIYYIIQ